MVLEQRVFYSRTRLQQIGEKDVCKSYVDGFSHADKALSKTAPRKLAILRLISLLIHAFSYDVAKIN